MLLNLPLFLKTISAFLHYTLGTFPTSWKQAHIFPIPKEGDKSNPLDYCPIAITSLISKATETIITKQLLTFLETNNLLSDHQYGFRKARSTGDLLAYAVHVWSSALESSGESRVISLDISKAFDSVWHKGLLAKLPMFGLHHTLIKWIGSFLSDRSIAVRVDGFSPICTQSMLVYPRALPSPLCSIFSSQTTELPLRPLAFAPLLKIPSQVLHFHSIQMTMLPPISNSTETFQPRFSPMI